MCVRGVAYNCGNISGWPPLPYPLFPPSPQQPPRQPPPNPPPPRAFILKGYDLFFPPAVGFNVKVVWPAWDGYTLSSPSEPIALRWHYYPNFMARPRVLITTRNPTVYTGLRPFVDRYGIIHISFDLTLPEPPNSLTVIQFLFSNQRWIVVVHEVYFPPVPQSGSGPTPYDYRLVMQNREEKLVAFWDSALQGLGSFTYRNLTIYLSPTEASIRQDGFDHSEYYYIQPTDNPAYCMFITG